MDRATRFLVWASFAAWVVGTIVFGAMLWEDSQPTPGSQDDVAAGLAGMIVVAGFGIFVLSTFIGVWLGHAASRRAPGERLPAIAHGLNIITLFGVLLSILVLAFVS